MYMIKQRPQNEAGKWKQQQPEQQTALARRNLSGTYSSPRFPASTPSLSENPKEFSQIHRRRHHDNADKALRKMKMGTPRT